MQKIFSIQGGLSIGHAKLVCQDLCRLMNYFSPEGVIARPNEQGLIYEGSSFFPKCVRYGELVVTDNGEVVVKLDFDSGTAPNESEAMHKMLSNKLARYFEYKEVPFNKKVFCIGWSKTGTMSLIQALRILGLFSWHFAPWIVGYHHFSDEIANYKLEFSTIEPYTAIADLPVSLIYKELDKAFPESLFIFTTRSLDCWLPSAMSDAKTMEEQFGRLGAAYRLAYGLEKPERQKFTERYKQHNQEVTEYFSDRSNFLSIDITHENTWDKLCTFLNLPIPNTEFPHLNHLSVD